MERIKQALEKAKKERQSRQATGGVGRPAQPENDLDNIQYTRTKKVSVSSRVRKKNHLIINGQQNPETDAYRVLRTEVTRIMRANQWNTLAVTSARPGEGKTLTSINLAISIAMDSNQTVLLVDFDLRKPRIHKYFEVSPRYGVADIVSKDIPVEDALFTPGVNRLVVLPGKTGMVGSSEILSSPKLVQAIEEMKKRYESRIIIFDLPPMLGMDDAMVLSDHIDAYLLVVENGKTQQEDLKRVSTALGSRNLIGTVLNKSDDEKEKYYQYYT